MGSESAPAVVNGILGGWRMTGINTMTSGQPVNITYSPASIGQVSGAPTYRPVYLGGDIYASPKTPTTWFNRAAFAIPDPSQPFGNLGRNIARTESIYNFDLGLHKEFPLMWETWSCSSGRSSSTCSTRRIWGLPSQSISNSNFGQITSLSSPARQIQFALKLVF